VRRATAILTRPGKRDTSAGISCLLSKSIEEIIERLCEVVTIRGPRAKCQVIPLAAVLVGWPEVWDKSQGPRIVCLKVRVRSSPKAVSLERNGSVLLSICTCAVEFELSAGLWRSSVLQRIFYPTGPNRARVTTFRVHSIAYFCIIPRNERKGSQRLSWRIAIASTSKK
jgi:hypothetical protein